MDKKEYLKMVEQYEIPPKVFSNAIVSFISGALLGSLYQTIMLICINIFGLEVQTALSLTCLLFIAVSCIFTGLGKWDNLVTKYRFGLIIPITGFAHSVASSILDYKSDGYITGMGSNTFKLAGSVILYGTITGILCAILKVIIYG